MENCAENGRYINILINGELYLFNYEIILQDYMFFLEITELQISSNIFECNNKIILKKEIKNLKLQNLTKLELVQVVGGG